MKTFYWYLVVAMGRSVQRFKSPSKYSDSAIHDLFRESSLLWRGISDWSFGHIAAVGTAGSRCLLRRRKAGSRRGQRGKLFKLFSKSEVTVNVRAPHLLLVDQCNNFLLPLAWETCFENAQRRMDARIK